MFLTVGWKRFACTQAQLRALLGTLKPQHTLEKTRRTNRVSQEGRISSMVLVHTTIQDVSLYFAAVHLGTGHL